MVHRSLLILLAASFVFLIGCSETPPISEYPPLIELPHDDDLRLVPVILVGRIAEWSPFGVPHLSKWDGDAMQLYRLAIEVENVLRGSVNAKKVEVFYYLNLDVFSGPARLGMNYKGGSWRIGDRKLFFLQRESGVLRTVCDTWGRCVLPVLSGAHPHFQRDPNGWVGQQITDILLDRGDKCDDQQLAAAIERSAGAAWRFSGYYAIKKLEGLVFHEKSAGVRKQACSAIASSGGPATHPPDPATASLRATCASLGIAQSQNQY